ncbi:glycosyltransferase family 4 protein [Rhizobium sp. 0TCS1.26]|uniref:glycosyltransferase family 4 protein n=1 Tax=Rhizobium sp. 0TCS1.26 TaxID=3142623 RepID=UPI003D2930B1
MPAPLYYLTSRDYARHTGGYVYNSRLVEALTQQTGRLETLLVETGFPSVPEVERQHLAERLATAPAGTRLVTDHIHLCDLLETIRDSGMPVVAIFHHALAIEHAGEHLGGRDAEWRDLRHREAAALAHAALVLATSQESRRYLQAEYQVDPDRILVRVPGNAPAVRTPVGRPGRVPNLLSVGAVIARKRYDILLQVASEIRDLDWRWRIAGDPDRDPALFAALEKKAVDLGLGHRLAFLGAVPDAELETLWRDSDLLLAASDYEGYGMAIAEALRHGVPVVTPASGAVSGWASVGVIEAPADDPQAMAALVRPLLVDRPRLAALADDAFTFGQTLPSWEKTFEGIGAWIGAHLKP